MRVGNERSKGLVASGETRAAPLVIAHRGASGTRPENTFSAYTLAVEQRADMIEIDLHRTLDEVTVIAHDDDLVRIGGVGTIARNRADEIRALDAGDGQTVPTLDEVLDSFGSLISFNLEIKSGSSADYAGIEAAALAAVESRELLSRTLFSAFSDSALERLRALSPGARIALLIQPATADRGVERALALGAEALNPWIGLVNSDLVASAHAAGLAVHTFTVNTADDMRRMLDLGVDGMFTNHPDRLRSLVDEMLETRTESG